MHQYVAVFLGDGQRYLAFKIKMILPAAIQCASGSVRRYAHGVLPVTTLHQLLVADEALVVERVIDRQDRFF